MSILTALGFTVPRQIDELAGELTYAEISAEQLGLLDRDVVVWDTGGDPGARGTIEANPVYQALDVAREVFIEEPVLDAAIVLTAVLASRTRSTGWSQCSPATATPNGSTERSGSPRVSDHPSG